MHVWLSHGWSITVTSAVGMPDPDDLGNVFSSKEWSELEAMFNEVTIQMGDTEKDSDNEFLQVTILAPIDKVDAMIADIYRVTETVDVGEELEAFLMMFCRGMLWQFMVERPNVQIDPDIMSHYLDGWEADDDDTIEFY